MAKKTKTDFESDEQILGSLPDDIRAAARMRRQQDAAYYERKLRRLERQRRKQQEAAGLPTVAVWRRDSKRAAGRRSVWQKIRTALGFTSYRRKN